MAPFIVLLIPDGRVIPSNEYCDYGSYQLPVREFAREEWLSGRFPLWIPFLGCGMPLHAGQQASLCYPLLSPFVLVFGANRGIKLSVFLHMVLGYVGQYQLCRAFAISRAGSSFAAVVSAQSAFVTAHLMEGHVTMVLAASLIPWFFFALTCLLRDPGPLSAGGIATVVAFFALAGHPQILYYAVGCGALWATGSLVVGQAAAHRGRFVAWAGIAAVVAVMLGMVQLLPTFELLRDGASGSERGDALYAGTLALRPLELLRCVSPNILGNPLRQIPEFGAYEFGHERSGYLGVATPVLALYALTRCSTRGWEYGAGILTGGAILIALGHSTPAFGVLGECVPGLFLFRCPGRVFCVVAVVLPLLAARGFDDISSRQGRMRGWRLAAVLVTLWLVGNPLLYLVLRDLQSFPWSEYSAFYREHLSEQAVMSVLLAGLVIAAIVGARLTPSGMRRTCGFVLVTTIMDLWYHNAANFALAHEQPPRVPAEVLAEVPPVRFVHVPEPPRYTRLGLRYSKMVPAALRQQRTMVGTNEGGPIPGAVERLHRAVQRSGKAVLAVSACQYACIENGRRWEPIADVLPRIRFLPGSHAELATVPIEEARPADWPRRRFSFETRAENPHLLVLDVQVPTAGLLVVADTFYPGWKCAVDGEPREITRVHGAFRGVPVEAGEQRVAFRYEPASFRWGLAGTGTGLAGLCLLLGIGRRQGKSVTMPDSPSGRPGTCSGLDG